MAGGRLTDTSRSHFGIFECYLMSGESDQNSKTQKLITMLKRPSQFQFLASALASAIRWPLS